jgi:hypothetical protein
LIADNDDRPSGGDVLHAVEHSSSDRGSYRCYGDTASNPDDDKDHSEDGNPGRNQPTDQESGQVAGAAHLRSPNENEDAYRSGEAQRTSKITSWWAVSDQRRADEESP